jgi:hypothetical protein
VLDKIAYTLLNPIRAGLVGQTGAWEGATSASLRFGGRRLVTRPTNFFSDDMPDQASLKLVAPDLHDGLDEQLAARIEAVEREMKSGRMSMGMRAVLAQPRLTIPPGTRPFGALKRLSVGFFSDSRSGSSLLARDHTNHAASAARHTAVRSGKNDSRSGSFERHVIGCRFGSEKFRSSYCGSTFS